MTTAPTTLSRAALLCALIVGGTQAFAAAAPDGLWQSLRAMARRR